MAKILKGLQTSQSSFLGAYFVVLNETWKNTIEIKEIFLWSVKKKLLTAQIWWGEEGNRGWRSTFEAI